MEREQIIETIKDAILALQALLSPTMMIFMKKADYKTTLDWIA
jgi:hypothetical protein